jgi:hypothetical protein
MNGNLDTDGIRGAALDRIEGRQRAYRFAFLGAAASEAVLLLLFVLLADFSNRVHVLILIGACLVYWTLALGLVALGVYMDLCTRRVLKALELLDRPR